MESLREYQVENGPEWAFGCGHCSYGVVAAMELTRVTDLPTERVVQYEDGLIEFCDCQAGVMYKTYVMNHRQKLIEAARNDPRMQTIASRNTHPDILNARAAMYVQREPNVHEEVQP